MFLIVRVSTFAYSFCRFISLQLKWSDTIWLCGGEWEKWWIRFQLYTERKSKARWSIYDYILLNKKHYYYDYLFISAKNEWSKNYKTWHFDITNICDLSTYLSEFMLFNRFHFSCEGITSLWLGYRFAAFLECLFDCCLRESEGEVERASELWKPLYKRSRLQHQPSS